MQISPHARRHSTQSTLLVVQCLADYLASSCQHIHLHAFATAAAAKTASGGGDSKPLKMKKKDALAQPEVIDYMQRLKDWKKHMHDLRLQWRTELLIKHREQEAQTKAVRIAAQQATQQQENIHAQHQTQRALAAELVKAELELVVAETRFQKAQKYQMHLQQEELAKKEREKVLLEASRNWISREDLLARIHYALDNPTPFGFTQPLPEAKSRVFRRQPLEADTGSELVDSSHADDGDSQQSFTNDSQSASTVLHRSS